MEREKERRKDRESWCHFLQAPKPNKINVGRRKEWKLKEEFEVM